MCTSELQLVFPREVGRAISRARKGFLAPDVAADMTDEAWEMRMRKSRCSAFVRLADQNSDILVGHATWDDYSKMTRIFKSPGCCARGLLLEPVFRTSGLWYALGLV